MYSFQGWRAKMGEDLVRSELSSVNHKAFTGDRRLCQGGGKLNVKGKPTNDLVLNRNTF